MPRLQRKSKARTRQKMLQNNWYLRVGSDVRHFSKVRKSKKNNKKGSKSSSTPGTTAREKYTHKSLPQTSQNGPKMVPGALPRGPEAAPRAPKCSPRSLQQTPPSSNITPEASKVGPRGLRGTSRTPSGPQNGGPGKHLDLKMEVRGSVWTSKWGPGGPA